MFAGKDLRVNFGHCVAAHKVVFFNLSLAALKKLPVLSFEPSNRCSRDAIFPDFSGLPDYHKSKLTMKNL